VEIIGGAPRRRWTLEQKLAIVEATFQPGASVNGVARQAGANPGMVFSWRKQFRDQLGFPEQPKTAGFAQVMLAPPEEERDDPAPGVVEVDFPGGARARIFGPVEPGLAIAVISALTKR
jgi:transposase